MCPKITTEEWIINAREIHDDVYNYSKSFYIGEEKAHSNMSNTQ